MINSYYKILGLEKTASISEIKKAYRDLAKTYHPDINHNENAPAIFILVNEAYEILIKWKSNKSNFDKKKSIKKPFNKAEWLKKERMKARQRAVKNAQKKFNEFKNSKTYKTAMVFSSFVDFVFMFIALTIIIVPMIYTIKNGFDEKIIESQITAIFATSIFGSIMLFIIVKNSILFDKNSL